MTADDRWYERAAARIVKLIAVLSATGILAAWLWRGWAWGAGFALGAVISWLNFRWWKQLTDALGGARLRRTSALFLAFRYILLGGGAYVILRASSISLPGMLAGLFVAVAAVILEILYELIYART